ncbi:ABC transporter substrate-binding protein [Rhodospirillum sp. A1_3_36]|uniref:ABC transporter substrate-binding protein n=1 Tax=Rhodospirillum sp. A1_3_36 TaxID=3391666 RepID=UPI0039A5E4F7
MHAALKHLSLALGKSAIALAALCGITLGALSFASLAEAEQKGADLPTAPVLHDGAKWRIGYMEGGQYIDYQTITMATLKGLADLGWMEPIELPADLPKEPGAFWRYVAQNAKSQYLDFVADAYYAPGNFDKDLRPKVKAAVLERLNKTKDIDLMIAMGTWAGQDLSGPGNTTVPVVIGSTSDPIGAGIIKSAEDSGQDNIHAKVEPKRYQRQVGIFNDIIPFSKLGIVYSDTAEGRTYGGVDAVEEVAKERGFDVVSCVAPYTDLTQEQVEQGVLDCYTKISKEADAIYITVHRGVTEGSLPKIMEVINAAKLPSFSMLGSSEVRRGVLMSVAQADFSYVGQFQAEVIAKILNGAKPRDIDQRWSAPPKIALNLKEAEIIGFDPPVDILIASDEIYENIED